MLVCLDNSPAFAADISNRFLHGNVTISTWKSGRDSNIVKQDLDYSCGAASAATIINYFYGVPASEADLIDEILALGKAGAASFEDLARAVEPFGFVGRGVAISFAKLKTLKIPAIVYIKYRGNKDHFSVLRGINDDDIVWLGDPSWGNRRFTRHQFLSMWETRADDVLKGKALLIIPKDLDSPPETSRDFFQPPETLSLPVQLLTMGRR